MMYKKTKGFSLAELLISLLIISIVLAAAIPTITKRRAHSPENVWNWANKNNVAYFGVGHNQSAIIGYDMMPFSDKSIDEKIDKYFDTDSLNADTNDFRFTTDGDKLVLVRRFITKENKSENMKNSHISFYNVEDRESSTARDLIYAGRISSDQHNLAFGIASLQSVDWVDTKNDTVDENKGRGRGYNTALGHYTLSFLKSGAFNTAIGESALTLNFNANRNTAVGAYALNTALGHDNTALGANAGKYIDALTATSTEPENTSIENTLIGANTMSIGIEGDDVTGSGNTALGATACGSIIGNDNICIGRYAGTRDENGDKKLDQIIDNHGVYIGHDPYGAPLIFGHSSHGTNIYNYDITNQTSGTNLEKELNVNARFFRVKTYDAGRTMFEIVANAGAPNETTNIGGYEYGSGFGRFGEMHLTLKDIQGQGSIRMSIDGTQDPEGIKGVGDVQTPGVANLYFFDPEKDYTNGRKSRLTHLPLIINSMLKIYSDPLKIGGTDDRVKIVTGPALEINGAIKISKNGSNITGKPYAIHSNQLFIDIDGNGNNQVLKILNKDTSKDPIMSIYKDSGNITFAPNEFHIADTAEKIGLSAAEININSDIGVNFNINGNNTTIGQTDISTPTNPQGIGKAIEELRNSMGSLQSDARLKNISGDSTAGLKEINALEVKNYTYKKDEKKTPHVGVIAQQLQKVFPNSVFEDEDGYLKIRTEEIFYAMVNSIKELFVQIQDLTAKIVGLDKRITELEQENALLKKQNIEFEKRLSKLEAKMEK